LYLAIFCGNGKRQPTDDCGKDLKQNSHGLHEATFLAFAQHDRNIYNILSRAGGLSVQTPTCYAVKLTNAVCFSNRNLGLIRYAVRMKTHEMCFIFYMPDKLRINLIAFHMFI
jgi:hypothetical protein